jgi:hypothetical protein
VSIGSEELTNYRPSPCFATACHASFYHIRYKPDRNGTISAGLCSNTEEVHGHQEVVLTEFVYQPGAVLGG